MATRASKKYWARYDSMCDRGFAREEDHYAEHGSYSKCADKDCDNECNPSNVHASGKKYCDDCWNKCDEE